MMGFIIEISFSAMVVSQDFEIIALAAKFSRRSASASTVTLARSCSTCTHCHWLNWLLLTLCDAGISFTTPIWLKM